MNSPPTSSRLPTRNGALSPRSISDSYTSNVPTPSSRPTSMSSSAGGGSVGNAPAPRKEHSPSTLPSIRSLRNKFQSLGGGGGGHGPGSKKGKTSTVGPKVVKLEEPPSTTTHSAPSSLGVSRGVGGMFGFRKSSNPEQPTTPTTIHTAASPSTSSTSPAPPKFVGYVQRPSVDSVFAAYGVTNSPPHSSFPRSTSSPALSTRSNTLPSLRPKSSDSPRYHYNQPPPSSPFPPTVSAPTTPFLSPTPPSPSTSAGTTSRKLANRISSDFIRSADEPTLAQLRATSPRPRSQSLNRRSHRHSQSTIPKTFDSNLIFDPATLNKPLPVEVMEKRDRHVSSSSWTPTTNGVEANKDDMAFRRHSIASNSSPGLRGNSPNPTTGGWDRSWSITAPSKSPKVEPITPSFGGGGGGGGGGGTKEKMEEEGAPPRGKPFPPHFDPVPIAHFYQVPDQSTTSSHPHHHHDATTNPSTAPIIHEPTLPLSFNPSRLSTTPSLINPDRPISTTMEGTPRSATDYYRMGDTVSVRSSASFYPNSPGIQIKPRLGGIAGEVRTPRQSAEIMPDGSRHGSLEDSEALSSSALRRSKSAIDSVRSRGGLETNTGSVESGSPIFVIAPDTFVEAGGGVRRRSSSSSLKSNDPEALEKEKKEKKDRRRSLRGRKSKSENYSEALSKMLAAGEWNRTISQHDFFDSSTEEPPIPNAEMAMETLKSRDGSPLASPLDDLITELGGRRPSTGSSMFETGGGGGGGGRPFGGDSTTTTRGLEQVEAVEDGTTTTTTTTKRKSRPPSAPPSFDIPDTPIGDPVVSFDSPPRSMVGVGVEDEDTMEELSISKQQESEVEEEEEEDEDDKDEPLDPDRTLTLDQMEREIARMEAELALSGQTGLNRSPSPSPSPSPSHTTALPSTATTESNNPTPQRSQTPTLAIVDSLSPSSIPPPSTTIDPSSSSSTTLERNPSTSSSSLNEITPRTARKWSIVEVERAYQRMRGMLGSTRSFVVSEAGDTPEGGGGGGMFDEVAVENAFEVALGNGRALKDAQEAVGETEGEGEGDGEGQETEKTPTMNGDARAFGAKDVDEEVVVKGDEESMLEEEVFVDAKEEESIHRRTPNSGVRLDEVEDDLLMLLTPNRISTPVPLSLSRTNGHLSLVDASPSHKSRPTSTTQPLKIRTSDSNLKKERSPGSSFDSQDDLLPASSSNTSPSRASHHKASLDSLLGPPQPTTSTTASASRAARAARRHTLNAPVSQDSLHDVFTAETASSVASSTRRRRGSDSSTNNPMPRPYTSTTTAPRLSRSRTTDSVPSFISDAEDDGWGATAAARRAKSPASVRASSRLSNSAQMKSGAGRDLQRWLAEDEAGTAPPSPGGSLSGRDRAAARLSLKEAAHLRSPELEGLGVVNGELPLTPSKRRSVRTPLLGSSTMGGGGDGNNTWFPVTPDRAAQRRAARSSLNVREATMTTEQKGNDMTQSMMSHASINMANIRNMDKLEIFFKYTAVKAEFDKAELERDALLDALQESRSTLADIRKQRDGLEDDLRKERSGKPAGSDVAEFEEVSRSRQTWETRARDALDEVERLKEKAEVLRREVKEGREREEQLERETVMMGAKLAAAELGRGGSSPAVVMQASRIASPRIGNPSSRNGSPRIGSPRPASGTNSPKPSGSPRPHRRAGSAPASPTIPRSPSQNSGFAAPSTPASKLASAYRARTNSTASSFDVIEANEIGELGSPLMGQTMAFGPKSSYGSYASPLKSRSPPSFTADERPFSPERTPPPLPPKGVMSGIPMTGIPGARTQFTRLRLPMAIPSPDNRLSRMSTASSIDYGDHLPPKAERDWTNNVGGSTGSMPELAEDDERFLTDLSLVSDDDER